MGGLTVWRRLRDLSSFAEVNKAGTPRRMRQGLPTDAEHLCLPADVSDYAATGRYAEADLRIRPYELIPSAGPQHHGCEQPNFLAAPVPEPGTWALMAGGLLAPLRSSKSPLKARNVTLTPG